MVHDAFAAAAREFDGRRVVRVPTATLRALPGALRQEAMDADIVIGVGDVVLKDRNGPAPRYATAAELAAAVTPEEVLAHGR